jgi:hypothetical protein
MSEQPGQMNTPEDSQGEGTVDLGDRVDGGAPAANQRAREHVLEEQPSMTVGEGDPQAPSHPAAADRGVHVTAPEPSTSPEEQVTDVTASAAQVTPGRSGLTGPGEPQGVPVPSTDAAPGTSEDRSGVVQGARTPAGGS